MTMPSGEGDVVSALEADLAALAAAAAALARHAEVAERTRIERSRLSLADRLRAASGYVHVSAVGGAEAHGPVVEVCADAVVIGHLAPGRAEPTAEHLLRLDAVRTVAGLVGAAPLREGSLPPRSTAAVLRSWCRDRSEVAVALIDGTTLAGLASASYADHLELAVDHGSLAVPLASIAAVVRHH